MNTETQADSSTGIASFAIRNPHFIIVIALMVTILGGLSVVILPKDLLPPANMPAVQILSFYSGMPVVEVENSLSAGFERYTGQAVGMDHQESKSLVGVSIVRNFFNPETDLNTAIAQTTSLVMSALRRLPPGTMPPLILPFDPMAAVPLALVAVSGDFPEKILYDRARYDVGNTIQAVPGAMAPTVMGGAERQILVYADPAKLRSYNLSPLNVLDRITQFNTFIPSGDIKIGHFDYQILSNGIVDHVQEMNDFPLRTENGVPVYVKNIGHAQDAHKIQTNIVMVDGKRQVYVPVYRQPGANSIRVVDEVKEALKTLEATLPGFKLRLVADQSSFIRHAISSITDEAVIGGGLAALMVLLFLGNPTATFGILLSLPLSLLCAFIGLKASGQTVNAMTLGGLALAIGVLVDNSIVVLENIIHHLPHSKSPQEAARRGAAEVGLPVLAATLSTLVVFFPVVFLSGIVKILFGALAKAVIFAMIGSYFSAMAIIPLFSAAMLKKSNVATQGKSFFAFTHGLVVRLTEHYGRALLAALKHRRKVLAGIAVGLVLGASLLPMIGTELFPRADAGSFVLELRQPTGTRIEDTETLAKAVEAKLRQWIAPEDLAMIITNAGVYYGFPAAFTPNSGPQDVFFNIALTEDRKETSQYYAKIIREKLPKEFPELDIGIELGGLLTSALNGGLRAPIDVQIQGPVLEKSGALAQGLAAQFKKLRGAVDVRVQQRFDAPAISIEINRKLAGEAGITTEEIIKNVVSAVSGSSTFNPSIWVDPNTGIDYLLGVQFPEGTIENIGQLANVPITGRHQEREIPLSKLAKLSMTKSPSEINHVNLKPVVDIYMDAQGRDVGSLSSEAERVIASSGLPAGYTAKIHGEISEMKKSVGSLGGGFFLAAILVYLILVVQFRSFLLPTIIMATVPMGMVGIIVMLAATHTYFSIQAAIGAIFMIGIAVANGVLLIEFIVHELRHESKVTPKLDQAIVNGAKARLRPILMTSLASMLGLVPMAIGLGRGSEANIPLGRAVIGGQLLSTTLTLFVVPILFRILYRVKKTSSPSNSNLTTDSILVTALIVAGLAASHPASASDTPRVITLREALDRVQSTDPGLKAAQAREFEARSAIGIAQASYFPTLDLEAIDSTGFPGSNSLTGVGGLMGSPYRSGLGAGLVLTQTLFDFGRTSAQVSAARFEDEAQKQEAEISRYQVEQEVVRAYMDCALNRAQMEAWIKLESEAGLVAREVNRYVRTGQRSIVERYLADTQKEQASTEVAGYGAKLKTSELRLTDLLGFGQADQPQVACPSVTVMDDQLGLTAAPTENPILAQAQAKAHEAGAALDHAKADYLPKVVGVGSVGYLQDTHLGDIQNYAVGVGIILPLFEGFKTKDAVQQAEASLNEKSERVNATRKSILDLNHQYDETIESSKIRLEHLDHELDLGSQAFTVAKQRYLDFHGTLVDVRDALKNLARVTTDVVETRTQLIEARGLKGILNGAR